jgi:hypothetical protein
MNFEPINISIKDIRCFTEIAYIIDSPLFIREADKIRKRYNITQPLRNNNIQQWTLVNIPKKKIQALFKEITDLLTFFSYDSNYQDVFEKAVFGCDIEASDYQSTHLVNFANLPPYLKYEKSILFGIIITPQTDKDDVVKAFKRYKQIEKELQSSPDSYSSTSERIDKRTEIERDRNGYWKRINKLTYWQIAQADGISRDDFKAFYKNRIREAIKSYKQKLGAK